MSCQQDVVYWCSWGLILASVAYFNRQRKTETPYGRYLDTSKPALMVPAKVAWFLQELPSFLVPMVLLYTADEVSAMGRNLLLSTFCLHYFQRTFIYSLLNKGRPTHLQIMISAMIFCSINGFFQGYNMLHCAEYAENWWADVRLWTGLIIFFVGMAINIHSDHILRKLRKPGEVTYKIPNGGLFEYVSGANFFGEILEWTGYAVATWTLPALAFAFFTLCSIGPRACHHHRFYLKQFKNYPRSRKALIPFIY
ncbi:3-oxo-5-alpha-steroid 4-dehydrogenase 2-like [Brienomyrus brachyistius]|uniref:3-oxo-5-alpha-steroid 4-dehydrogenase 2-like n=1 Tax=Brienomyrus brachyistius TaxID=42636 RepID=UPI0020B397F1|nr:3-oxo-5-alpha-steroid 4-dehydrogenase 2-like [Brienomyrus brachyistius]